MIALPPQGGEYHGRSKGRETAEPKTMVAADCYTRPADRAHAEAGLASRVSRRAFSDGSSEAFGEEVTSGDRCAIAALLSLASMTDSRGRARAKP